MANYRCECEHECHFEPQVRSPNGNPGHTYGRLFNGKAMSCKATSYGCFDVCSDCANDCMQDAADVDPRAYEGGAS